MTLTSFTRSHQILQNIQTFGMFLSYSSRMTVPYLCIDTWSITNCTSSESLEHALSDNATGYRICLTLNPVLTACFCCPAQGHNT